LIFSRKVEDLIAKPRAECLQGGEQGADRLAGAGGCLCKQSVSLLDAGIYLRGEFMLAGAVGSKGKEKFRRA